MSETAQQPVLRSPEEETRLALQALARARRQFFDLLEVHTNVSWDSRSMPDPKELDASLKDEDLLANRTRESMDDKLKFALIRVRDRENQCGAPHCDGEKYIEWQPKAEAGKTLAVSKLVGAYANLMAVLSEERIIKKDDAALAEANRKTIGVLYRTITKNLLSHARLKGRKPDVDGVLEAQLGEIPKSSKEFDWALKSDIEHITATKIQIEKLVEWMKLLATSLPKASAEVVQLIDQLHTEALDSTALRYNLKFERTEAKEGQQQSAHPLAELKTFDALRLKDEYDIQLDQTLSALKEKLHEVEAYGHTAGNGHHEKEESPSHVDAVSKPAAKNGDSSKVVALSRHIMRGADAIFDMVAQGAKPKAVRIVIGLQQLDTIKYAAEKIPDLHIGDTAKIKKIRADVDRLYEAARRSIKRVWYEGKQSNIDQTFKTVMGTLNGIEIPQSQSEDHLKLAALKEAMQLMHDLPSNISAEKSQEKEIASLVEKVHAISKDTLSRSG